MATFFQKEKFYDPVPEDGRIDLEIFLQKTNAITVVFDFFGTVFSPVKNDMNNNIEKIRKVMKAKQESGGEYKTINEVIEDEMACNVHSGKNSGTVAGVWLGRALRFMYLFFEQLVKAADEGNTTESNLEFVSKAYEDSLKKHHNWISKRIFTVALHAAPKRSALCRQLMLEKPPEDEDNQKINKIVLAEMKDYLVNLKATADAWNSQCMAITKEKYNSL